MVSKFRHRSLQILWRVGYLLEVLRPSSLFGSTYPDPDRREEPCNFTGFFEGIGVENPSLDRHLFYTVLLLLRSF